jgi:hypothetical protein
LICYCDNSCAAAYFIPAVFYSFTGDSVLKFTGNGSLGYAAHQCDAAQL